MNSKYSVELVNILKRFGSVVAVNDVSLSIRDGEFFSLLGPSGCGKTTTLRIIGGFEVPTVGEVLINGEPMVSVPPFRRPVNTVFQNYALFPHMNIFQNVAFGLQMKKVPKAEIKSRVEEILKLVQLPGMGKRKPSQLSGGQQQRVALARALINQPQLLLLDEPLGALDLKLRKAMQLELKRIQKQVGITFIYVTHDQEEALTMSDRIAVMSKGNVLQVGPPEEIYEHPKNRFVANFIGETNFMHGKTDSISGDVVMVKVDDRFTIPVPTDKTVADGVPVVLAVRPEKLHISKTPTSDVSIIGTVREIIYIGTDLRYEVAISENTVLTVREQNRSGDQADRFQNGDEVHVCWDQNHVSLLTE